MIQLLNEPSQRRPAEDERHDGHVRQHAEHGDRVEETGFRGAARRTGERPRAVRRAGVAAEAQIRPDDHGVSA